MQLEDKVAIVTGAGRGMGRAIALQLAREGAHVVAADIDAASAEQTSSAVRELGRRSLAIEADVGELADIDRIVQQTVETLGRIDIGVNNAGVTRRAVNAPGVTRQLIVTDVTEEDWDFFSRVNAKGVFFCMQRMARELIRQGDGGRIINVASIAGKGYTGTSNAAYAATKGAVIAMTQIAAHQLARFDINVNSICPGATRTGFGGTSWDERAEEQGLSLQEYEQQRASGIPIGRFNEPEDIAALALFLAGPGSRNITGQAYNVDGGLVMH
ncbi:MAG: SDR family oxidoreductase [Chloroflexi bacterium]|nr:SDR family oxidoreductase [Chloroflexota bacterium]